MTITIIDLDIVPFAIPLQLKTGPVERRNLGVLVGEVGFDLCTKSLAHLESAFPPVGSATATSTARIAATRRLPSALLIPPVFLAKLSRASSVVRMGFSA